MAYSTLTDYRGLAPLNTSLGHKMVSRTQLNAWRNLRFYDPALVLKAIGELAARPVFGSGSWDYEKLTQRSAKSTLEKLDAAIVAYLLGKHVGFYTAFAPVESSDYDCIVSFDLVKEISMNPVQLKEVVPSSVNSAHPASLINSLIKYSDSKDLIVAIKLSRELNQLEFPLGDLGFAGVYLYGQHHEDQNRLWLQGDCQRESGKYEYCWPS